jgi:16S rRNA (guanine527-N7)-methyltransferase
MSDAVPPPEAARLAELGVTPRALADLQAYRRLLYDANQGVNLVGASTLAEFWTRHALDSAQLRALAPEARVWADVGSGGGLPGVVLAILLREDPGARVHLVESVAKKCAFLSRVVAALDLPAEVHHARAEDVDRKVEVVTARAVAPLPRLLGFVRPLMKKGTLGLFLKGAGVDTEVMEARKLWRFACTITDSLSDPRGRILAVTELARAARR